MSNLAEKASWINDQVWNQQNLALVPECFAPDFVGHVPDYPKIRGPHAFVAFAEQLRGSLPDLEQRVEAVVWEGDQVFLRTTLTGTQRGEFLGIPPTNRPVRMSEMLWLRFDSKGKIAELWRESNPIAAMDQLGLVPPESAGPLGRFWHTVKIVGRFVVLQTKAEFAKARGRKS